jgi:release factor glutamine methyltransferase
MTIREKYLQSQSFIGIGSVELYAIQQIFLHHLKLSSLEQLMTRLDQLFLENDVFEILFNRLKKGEPLAYIIGHSQFLNLRLKVNPDVLIPRPETEELVMKILRQFPEQPIKTVLDIGTGSGAIAIALKKHRPSWQMLATEVSLDALKVAQENADLCQVNINFYHGDGVLPLNNIVPFNSIDIVVSNPPYVGSLSMLDASVRDYEPHLALIAEPATRFYEQYLIEAKPYLKVGGCFVFEISPELVNPLKVITLNRYPQAKLDFSFDINQKKRFLMIYT